MNDSNHQHTFFCLVPMKGQLKTSNFSAACGGRAVQISEKSFPWYQLENSLKCSALLFQREIFIQEKTAMAHCLNTTIKDLRALSVLSSVFNLFWMFLLMFFTRYSGTRPLSGTERQFSVTTRNLLQWHWANPLVDNYGSILLHLGFFLISPESCYLMPVMISQALTLLTSAKSQIQPSGLIGSWLIRGEKIKLCNEGNSSDAKEIVYYFKIAM